MSLRRVVPAIGLLLLAAASLLLTVICPIAAGAAIRAGRE